MKISRNRLLWSVLLSASCLVPTAEAVEGLLATQPGKFRPVTVAVSQPQFHIPPSSRLARNEHPRFLLVPEDLDTLRQRLVDPRLAPEYQALKRQAEESRETDNSGWKRALLWKLTGDRKYLEAARRAPGFRRPTWIFGWAAMMDLLWYDLPAEERRELSDLVAKAVSRDGSLYWRPTLHLVSVLYEGGQGPNDALFLDRMRRDFDETLVQWTDKLNHWAAGRGGSDMSHGYNGEHAYWEPFVAAIAWTHGTGEDYLDRAAFARYQSAFWNGKERVPHPNPGGHTAMAGEMFTVESGSPAKPGGGWLAVRTLAPSVGDFERRKIGGKDHDFEVAGVQYGLTDEGYQMAESPYAVRSTIGLLGWRVELRPKTSSRTVEFLHLLQVGVDGQTPSMLRDARHEPTPDMHQITLRPGDQQIILRLNRTGDRAGSIGLSDPSFKGQESLPLDIEDHWRAYRDHPHFRSWVTDPRYRVVIEPTKPDRQALNLEP